jgi:large subunit ribosomal protein L24
MPSDLDYEVKAEQHVVASRSAEPVSIDDILTIPSVPAIVPKTTHAPPPKDQSVADVYRAGGYEDQTANLAVDALMPLYLSEELSPRFAKHTLTDLYKIRKEQREAGKKAYIEAAVQQWKDLGRDRFLREIMDTEEANLRGVPLKPRSEREIREVAEIEWQQETERELLVVSKRLKRGYQWNYEEGKWVNGPRAQRRVDKLAAKQRKAHRLHVYLENLKLKQGKNMVVPEEARKEPKKVVVQPKRARIRPDDLFAKYLRT